VLKRVVVTGMAGITALGSSWPEIHARLRARQNATRYIEEWERFKDIDTRLAAPVVDFQPPEHWTRRQLRGMGRVSQFAVRATELALADAGLLGDERLRNGRAGVACGSCVGSTPDILDFSMMILNGTSEKLSANSYVSGEHRHFLWAQRPHHSDIERVHVGESGHRLCL
jgi:3-oxoacyl-[acyl-carrier-protein] synthase II